MYAMKKNTQKKAAAPTVENKKAEPPKYNCNNIQRPVEFQRIHPYGGILQNTTTAERKPLFTIKVGAITQWVRDILTVVLLWKVIFAI